MFRIHIQQSLQTKFKSKKESHHSPFLITEDCAGIELSLGFTALICSCVQLSEICVEDPEERLRKATMAALFLASLRELEALEEVKMTPLT